jgi:hypothetical protein
MEKERKEKERKKRGREIEKGKTIIITYMTRTQEQRKLSSELDILTVL